MITHQPRNNYPLGCEQHLQFDCGCPGYPSIQNALRDCGNNCQHRPHINRCVRCQAAQLIDTLQTRTDRFIERIIELQDEIERNTPPAGHLNIPIPIETAEQIVDTNRILFALETIRTAITQTYNGNNQ